MVRSMSYGTHRAELPNNRCWQRDFSANAKLGVGVIIEQIESAKEQTELTESERGKNVRSRSPPSLGARGRGREGVCRSLNLLLRLLLQVYTRPIQGRPAASSSTVYRLNFPVQKKTFAQINQSISSQRVPPE